MIGGLALADILGGLTYLVAGIARMMITSMGLRTRMVTPWQCLTRVPQAAMFVMFAPLAAVMLMCVSIDRLYAVVAPLHTSRYTPVLSI